MGRRRQSDHNRHFKYETVYCPMHMNDSFEGPPMTLTRIFARPPSPGPEQERLDTPFVEYTCPICQARVFNYGHPLCQVTDKDSNA